MTATVNQEFDFCVTSIDLVCNLQNMLCLWYLARFSWWFQFSWYTCISPETVFYHKSSSLPASTIHIVQEKHKILFYEGYSIFFIDQSEFEYGTQRNR